VMRNECDEAWKLTEVAARSKTFDVAVPVVLRTTRAKVMALNREHQTASNMARRATTMADQTDLLTLQADAYKDLGDVLHIGGEHANAQNAWRGALDRYMTKGNVISAAMVRSRLRSGC
jgi:hypothetical protein